MNLNAGMFLVRPQMRPKLRMVFKVGVLAPAAIRTRGPDEWLAPFSSPEFQAAFVCFQESTQVLSGIKQPGPLLVIQCDREASQSIDTYAAFLAHLETYRASLLCCHLFLKFGNPGQNSSFVGSAI